MIHIHYYLQSSNAAQAQSIVIHLSCQKSRMRISSGWRIDPAHWNRKLQRAIVQDGFNRYAPLNRWLDETAEALPVKLSALMNNGLPFRSAAMRSEAVSFTSIQCCLSPQRNFWSLFDEFVEFKRRSVNDKAALHYHYTLRRYLRETEAKYGFTLKAEDFKDLPGGPAEQFDYYMLHEARNSKGQPGLAVNTAGKQIKNLKVFLNWLFDKGYCERFPLKHLVGRQERVETVFLNEAEIKRLSRYRARTRKEVDVLNLFLLGCETGLRFSDLNQLQPGHVQKEDIVIYDRKTRNKVFLPIGPRLRNQLNRMPEFPRFDSITEFNSILRSLCKRAGISEEVIYYTGYGSKTREVVRKKWEMVSSHTARRSFCTNKFLRGMPPVAIMKFTGHKTETAFMAYLRISSKLAAREYRRYF